MEINFQPRPYQEEIVNTSVNNNTLVVLPTGTGKTAIAILTAIKRLKQFPRSNILVLTPTKPLSSQIQKEFKEKTTINKDKINLLTGEIPVKLRQDIWGSSFIIVATPQTIQKEIEKNNISLGITSLLIVDECHRSRENYANTKVAHKYIEQSKFPRILALTASPGGTKEKINEIKTNLHIEQVEIKTEKDIKEFIQEKKVSILEVELSKEFKEILVQIKKAYNSKLNDLKKIGFTKPSNLITKGDLLKLQNKFRFMLKKGDKQSYYGLYITALLIKIDYAAELLETQGIYSLFEFWKKIRDEETKASKSIYTMPEILRAVSLTEDLVRKDIRHPKIYMLKGIVRKELEKNPNSKIIVFANYINTINEIMQELNKSEIINATKLVGQRSGLKQKQQIETIKRFEEGEFNVMVTSSIGEEGIDIKGATMAIMFDQGTSSEIRKIQRAGRVGRLEEGKIVLLLTRDTREVGYYWASMRKEKNMRNTLKGMQEKTLEEF